MAAQREWYEKDYYKVLGVSEDATPKDITKAYRKLARGSHPDAHPGDDAAEERFKEISAAYDVLGDEAKRKEYDEIRRLGPIGGFQGGEPGWTPVDSTSTSAAKASATSSARCSAAGDAAAARRRPPVRNVAPMSRRPSTSISPTPPRASPPPCTSPATRNAAPVTAAAPSPARSQRCARTAAAAG